MNLPNPIASRLPFCPRYCLWRPNSIFHRHLQIISPPLRIRKHSWKLRKQAFAQFQPLSSQFRTNKIGYPLSVHLVSASKGILECVSASSKKEVRGWIGNKKR